MPEDKSQCTAYPLSLDQGTDGIKFYYCAKCGFNQLSQLTKIHQGIPWFAEKERNSVQKNHDTGSDVAPGIHEQFGDTIDQAGVPPGLKNLLLGTLKK